MEVDMDNWDDDELIAELEARGVSGYGDSRTDDDLRTIHEMMKLGHQKQAYEAMYDYVRNKLGVAI
jgi:hypothetical protein